MKKITLLLLMLLTSIVNAQVANYGFSQGTGTYTPLTSGTVVASFIGTTLGADRMDDVVYNLPTGTIPFTFTYDGVGYTGLNISSNGFITFGATAPAATNYAPLSAVTTYAGAIAPFGRDIEGGYTFVADRTLGSADLLNATNLGPAIVGNFIYGTGIAAGTTITAITGTTITMSAAATSTGVGGVCSVGGPATNNIQYQVLGTAPNRTFVIQYMNFKRFGTTLTTVQHMNLNFQIRLSETSNTIKVVYGNCTPGVTTFVTVNQIGLRGDTNDFATDVNNRMNVKGTTDWATSTPGTLNTSGELFNNVAPANVIPSGLTYTWAPPILNNDCTGATSLTVGAVFATNPLMGTNVGATASEIATPSIPAPGCSIYAGGDVWYSVTVPSSGNVTIETNPVPGSTLDDTGLAVYSGACGTLALVSCNDDASIGFFSKIILTGRTPGELLYVRVFEYQNNIFDTFMISAYDCPATMPTGAAAQTFCNTNVPAPTLASLAVTGTGLVWYDAATNGNVLPTSTVLTATTYYVASNNGTCDSPRLAITTTVNCTVAGCLTGFLFPSATFTPATCDGITVNQISAASWAGDYVNVNVTLGQTYSFRSSVATDFLTISTDNDATAAASGTTPLTWVSTVTGVIRFHINTNATCGTQNVNRTTSIVCGIPSTATPDWANIQSPLTATTVAGTNVTIYGQVYEAGLTDVAPNIIGQAPGIQAWVGYNATDTNPNTWTNWVPATWNAGHVSNNDEYQAGIGATLPPGTHYYATRFNLTSGPFVYGGTAGFWNGTSSVNGVLTVTPLVPQDVCSGAVALTVGGVFSDFPVNATLTGATTGTLVPTCQTSYNSDIWYTVVVPASGNITIETQVAVANTLTDTVVAVYSGTCSTTLTQVGCDDDGGLAGPNNFMSVLPLTGQTPLSTLYVVVSKFGTTAPSPTSNAFIVSAYDGSLANEAFQNSNFVAYPNPVKDVLNVSNTQAIEKVQVINLLGQEVKSVITDSNEVQIDMAALPQGTYLVRVTSNNEVKIIKVIKD